MSILPYTPGNMSYQELKACFVARQALLDELLETLKDQAQAETLQHWMILGSRGMGKTHLIRLYFHEILRRPGLSASWIPILMNEEEPEVFNLSTFFTRILEMLAESLENIGENDDAAAVAAFVEEQRGAGLAPARLADRSVDFLKGFSQKKKKRLVVLLENADDLFTKCLPEPTDVQKLRRLLSTESFLLVIGASPTFFTGISRHDGVFYDFFRLRRLELLGFEQARDLLVRWAQEEKDPAREEAFRAADSRLHTLYHLTGGNPRLLYFLYQAVTGGESLENATETFEDMLEKDLTAFYLTRMRDLPNQVQPIVITLAKSRKNLTQKEIAKQSFLPERSLGTQMKRLEEEDVVMAVSGKKGKNTVYALSDYLFRVWYQWRYAKQKEVILGLVEFLAIWFGRKELEGLCCLQGKVGKYASRALKLMESEDFRDYQAVVFQDRSEAFIRLTQQEDWDGAARELGCLSDYSVNPREAVQALLHESGFEHNDERLRRVLTARVAQDPKDPVSWKWLGEACRSQGDIDGAEQAFQEAAGLRPEEGASWISLGAIRVRKGDFFGARKALDEALSLNAQDGKALRWMGMSFLLEGLYASAERTLKRAVCFSQHDVEAWKWYGVTLFIRGNDKDAIKALTIAVDLDPKDQVVWKLLGTMSLHQADSGTAEQALEMSLELNPKDAEAWSLLGDAYVRMDMHVAAENAYQKAVDLSPQNPVFRNLLGKVLFQSGQFEKSIQHHIKALRNDFLFKESYLDLGRMFILVPTLPQDPEILEKAIQRKGSFSWSQYAHPAAFPKILETALQRHASPRDFRALLLLVQAVFFIHIGEKNAFVLSLRKGLSTLEGLGEKERRAILIHFSGFFVDVISFQTLATLKTFLMYYKKAPHDTALLSIVRPLEHVLEYAEACITEKAGAASNKARMALDRVPGELRGPVEEMTEMVRKNLEWQKKVIPQ
ncbi:MAG: tetratricopeptide repeat protein [Thermodesulfobacteriota bacterium]